MLVCCDCERRERRQEERQKRRRRGEKKGGENKYMNGERVACLHLYDLLKVSSFPLPYVLHKSIEDIFIVHHGRS